ncbi:aurora kinase [Halyomorpha halys]|uniref:aurora kinase n=1 Tax=Halyomorpha halys TaxID=286706 RepID=UPI0006D50CA1|nr:aurora kinase [Halyomorpha halys]
MESKNNKESKGPPKTFEISDFELGSVIGSGKFGRVYLAQEKKTRLLVAVKIIEKEHIKEQILHQQIFYEIYFHSMLRHPNIIRMYTYFHDSTSLYLILEFARRGSLYNNMRQQKYKRFTEDLAAKYIYQTADALKYCHDLYFFHGDVKPENILLDSRGNVKLSDFGLAWPSDSSALNSRGCLCGTRDYLAPELLKGEPYNEKVDHWSLGVLCFELLVGRSLFASKRRETTVQRILEVDIRFPKIVTEEAQDFISKLVKYQPEHRMSLEDAMSHLWIRQNFDVISNQ